MEVIKRKGIGNKKRFEVFKRDLFTCQYCGNKPPAVILEIDHIIPVIKGGGNEMENLNTSCFECNRGKSKNELNQVPVNLLDQTSIKKEKEKQYIEFKKFQSKLDSRLDTETDEIIRILSEHFHEYSNYDFKQYKYSIKNFISKLGYFEVKSCMEYSFSKVEIAHYCMLYFFKICWIKVNELKITNNG